jgi:hypothetical protein
MPPRRSLDAGLGAAHLLGGLCREAPVGLVAGRATARAGAVGDRNRYGPLGLPKERVTFAAYPWTGARLRYTGQKALPEKWLDHCLDALTERVYRRFTSRRTLQIRKPGYSALNSVGLTVLRSMVRR